MRHLGTVAWIACGAAAILMFWHPWVDRRTGPPPVPRVSPPQPLPGESPPVPQVSPRPLPAPPAPPAPPTPPTSVMNPASSLEPPVFDGPPAHVFKRGAMTVEIHTKTMDVKPLVAAMTKAESFAALQECARRVGAGWLWFDVRQGRQDSLYVTPQMSSDDQRRGCGIRAMRKVRMAPGTMTEVSILVRFAEQKETFATAWAGSFEIAVRATGIDAKRVARLLQSSGAAAALARCKITGRMVWLRIGERREQFLASTPTPCIADHLGCHEAMRPGVDCIVKAMRRMSATAEGGAHATLELGGAGTSILSHPLP